MYVGMCHTCWSENNFQRSVFFFYPWVPKIELRLGLTWSTFAHWDSLMLHHLQYIFKNSNLLLWVFKFYYDLHVPILYVEIRGWKNSRQAHEGPRRLLWIPFSLSPFSLQVLVVELRCSGLHDGCLTRWAISLTLHCNTFCVNFSHPYILKPKEITEI